MDEWERENEVREGRVVYSLDLFLTCFSIYGGIEGLYR